MATVAEALNIALQHHQAGDLLRAQAIYRQILESEPANPDALHYLGVIAHQQNNYDLAIDFMKESVEITPGNESYHSNLGLAYQAAGRLDEAITSFQQALSLQPALPEAHNNLGTALSNQGNFPEAVASYKQALILRPNYVEAHNNLGSALASLKKLDEAVASCNRALELWPDYAPAHNNLANALQKLGKLDEAESHCREALRLQPSSAEGHNNLGGIMLERGKNEEAAACFERALQLNPHYADTHCNLAAVLQAWGRLDEAETHLEQALALRPNFPGACLTLGLVRQLQGRPAEALDWYGQALRLDADFEQAQSNWLLCLNYDPKLSADNLLDAHRQWGQSVTKAVAKAGPLHEVQPAANRARPLRVGYVSPDFGWHSVAYFLEPILTNHDPEKVEAICYAEGTAADSMTARLTALANDWRGIHGLSDNQAAELIRTDRIDILVDLAGHTANSRLGVFALQPAPVQVTYLGYPCTTGLAAVDYCLTDAIVDPPPQPAGYVEELYRLPNGFCCYAPPAIAPDVGPLPASQKGFLTFGSFHHLAKLNDEVLDLWAALLRALPSAHLLVFRHTLRGTARDNLSRRLKDRGIEAERIEMHHQCEGDKYHFGVYEKVDISLDTFPWSGHTTACESLWMGVPTVTVRGTRHAGRMVASVLTHAGMPQWIADTKEQYVDIAAGLASDLDRLATIRAELRQKVRSSALCDGKGFTQTLEAAFRDIWQRWCG